MPTAKQIIASMATAMGNVEGYYNQGKIPTIPQRLNNPLDLRSWKKPDGTAWPEENGYVNFPACQKTGCTDPDHPCEIGWAAGRVQVSLNVIKRGLTFLEFFAGKPGVYYGFAPEKDKNEPVIYAQTVLARMTRDLGLPPTVTINTKILSLASDAPGVK